jgi:hypothetical protein
MAVDQSAIDIPASARLPGLHLAAKGHDAD